MTPDRSRHLVRVGDICGHPLLSRSVLHGVDTPGQEAVKAIELVAPRRALDQPLPAHGVVVLDLGAASPGVFGEHLVDILLRRCALEKCAMLIVFGATMPLAAASRQLAESLRLPMLLTTDEVSTTEVMVAVRTMLADPLQFTGDAVRRVAEALRRAPRTIDAVVDTLTAALPDTNVYACSSRDLILAGRPRLTSASQVVGFTDPTQIEDESVCAAVVPVLGIEGEPSVWLVAERERGGRLWLETAETVLSLCAGTVLAWLVRDRMAADRDARWRATLLAEILERGAALPSDVAEQAIRAGWALEGWHTGIHLRLTPADASPLAVQAVAEQLAPYGLASTSLVERTDGWAGWITVPREPSLDETRALTRQIRQNVQRPPSGHTLVIGIGSPQRDVEGIATTLAEARQAAVIASSSTREVTVRLVQDLGPARLLLGWYSSEAFAEYATDLLGPLVSSDEPDLLETLEAYLESACSTAATGRALGVHRNTVANRISRVERLLGTSLVSGDTRLALQLALRVMRSRPD